MKKYSQIYSYYKELIDNGQIKSGDKLPSIREAATVFSVSKTTIQNAYFDLQSDGYIISQPKSGYYVSDIQISNIPYSADVKTKNICKFDLKSGDADSKCFDLKLWQRYIKSALRQEERYTSYSEAQGEADLRNALAAYIKEKRNVITSPDRIVIGAGVNYLLSVLCSLIRHSGFNAKTVSFPTESFINGISVFEDYGFDAYIRDKNADIIYVSPSHMTSYGDVMPIKRRLELIKHSEIRNSLIIEDDYDSDFVYLCKPTPSLYALSGNRNVIYMGSFSNVLLPSIRISYMVLNDEFKEVFDMRREFYSQTAGKTEQIALCQYIRDGRIKAQTRKIRRIYLNKTKVLYEMIKAEIPSVKCSVAENGLMLKLTAQFSKQLDVFEKNDLSVYIQSYDGTTLKLVLIPSAVDFEQLKEAVNALKSALL